MENLNWYPGHMAKTRRLIEDNLKFIDAVVEIIDARIPFSGRNPCFDDMIKSKPRLILMNKSDLADQKLTDKWVSYYSGQATKVMPISCETNSGIGKILPTLREMFADRINSDKEKGVSRPIRIMIIGIPNVGKSTLINRISRRAIAKTGDRPGVTRQKQWVRLKDGLEMLDTPGILQPKFEDQSVAKRLAFTGAIKDEILETELLCYELLEFLRENYQNELKTRYKITDDINELKGYEILELIGRHRGLIISGGEVDMERAANIVFDEFRAAKIGRVTLEAPGE
ncbi:MAG: ribosome biogenesis GTPase YlqF [Eubacteriales bacterium]|nr:ribosome biogenesis GTPase YlqF [Eubacteriales bacterium]